MRFSLIAVCFLVAGCASGPPQAITWQDLKSAQGLKGKRVVIEGYPGLDIQNSMDHKGEQTFFLLDRMAGMRSSGGASSVAVTLPAGSGPDQAERLPKGYKEKDLKIYCHDGKMVGVKDKVRVTGTLQYTYGPSIDHATIEKL